MNETLALPPRLVVRDLMLTAMTQKWRIILIFFVVMAIAIGIAASIQPDYKAKSSLLVLLGTEHSFRPAAGQQFVNSGGVDSEQVLRTEASIIGSDDLHRTVIRDIGIERMYPKLLKKPTPVEKWIADMKRYVTDALGVTDPTKAGASQDPMDRAVDQFSRNLTITVDKKSSVIGVDFTNPDAQVASDALNTLETHYLAFREKLYNDVQAPIVKVQQQGIAKQLADADNALQAFKQQHDISNFADRRQILMRQQGDLEIALAKADSTVAGQQARLNQLEQQLAAATGNKKNAAAALQGMVQAFRQREKEAETTYRGSPAVDEARREALDRQTDIARMQSTQAFNIQAELDRAAADLRFSLAGHDAIAAQLTDLNKQIAKLNADELQLHQLERSRALLEDNYKAVSKILDEREIVETVEAHRESSVRVIQPPHAPDLPLPTRRLILMAGIIISFLLSIGSVLMAHFFRAIYLRPEALELDTGLTVLASVPEMRAIGGPSSGVLVVPG